MAANRRVLILTADAGFGHRSAAKAVEAALQVTYGDACEVELVNPLDDERVPAFLRNSQADYDRIVRDIPRLYKFGYEASDASVASKMIESVVTVILFEVTRDLVRKHRPDAVVTTYPLYQAPLRAVYLVSGRHIPLLTVVTDLTTVHSLWFHEAVDRCLVATEQVRDLALAHGLSSDQVQITGIPVSPDLDRERRKPATIRTELGWRTDLVTVLAVGGKRVGNLGEVLRALNHSGLPLQLAVVAGGDDRLYQTLFETTWHAPTRLYNFVDNMPTLMHASDCIVCKAGGLIVAEALACGLPLLLIDVLPGQETGNARYVVDGGAGELVRTPLEALETLCHWFEWDGGILAEHTRNAQKLGRPQAAYEVAEIVWAVSEQGATTRPFHHERPRVIELLTRFGVPWGEELPARVAGRKRASAG